MPYFKKAVISFVFLCAIPVSPGMAYAVDDGYGAAGKAQGKYAVVYYPSDINIPALNRQLNIRPSDKVLTGSSIGPNASAELLLTDMLDTLFLQICDIMDMHLYSLQVNIKVCADQGQLDDIYKRLFSADLGGRKSFYVFDLNSIYISRDSFRREILGHEMAHAIMSHYFVVQPSVKVQEVLAMYVEYNLRKGAR